jgi:5-aminolevulinate synthase
MDYSAALDQAIGKLHEEGRYRTFIDIERRKGAYPQAVWTRPDGTETEITVWCGNDYLGMGQHPVVLKPCMRRWMRPAPARAGRAIFPAPPSITRA